MYRVLYSGNLRPDGVGYVTKAQQGRNPEDKDGLGLQESSETILDWTLGSRTDPSLTRVLGHSTGLRTLPSVVDVVGRARVEKGGRLRPRR